MKFLFLVLVCAASLAQESRPLKAPRPAGPVMAELRLADVRAFTPANPVDEFEMWVRGASRHLSERFEVPEPEWVFDASPTVMGCPSFDTPKGRIHLFRKWPNGVELRVDELRHVYLHGFLHYLEKCRGLSHSTLPEHVGLFDRLLQMLGLWRPKV